MIPNAINDIKHKRAEFARDVAYVKEMALSDQDDSMFEMALGHFEPEVSDYSDLRKLDSLFNESADTDEEEINRILSANSDLSFDEMLGIDE